MPDDLALESFDATDPAAIANADRESKRKAREDADILRFLMQTKKGRAFLYRRLEMCHIYGAGLTAGITFAPGQPDMTAFQLGQENIGKRLMMEAMDASPDLYVQMMREQREEEARLDEVRRREERNREVQNRPMSEGELKLVYDLPPPAGYPGGPALPKKDKKK